MESQRRVPHVSRTSRDVGVFLESVFNRSRRKTHVARGPLKPNFGLSGDVHIARPLSSRPEEIIANAMMYGVEGPCVCL